MRALILFRKAIVMLIGVALTIVATVTFIASPASAGSVRPNSFVGASFDLGFGQTNTTLHSGRYTMSGDGRYGLIMQNDGNLVLYGPAPCGFLQPDNCPGPYGWWATNTGGQPGNRAVMQSDGNLVVYRSDNSAAWASNTSGSGANFVNVRSTGMLVLGKYDGTVVKVLSGAHLDATNLSGYSPQLNAGRQIPTATYIQANSRIYHLLLQTDGNLLLYGPGYHVLWSTHTYGTGVDHLVMQSDGNLVLYRSNNTAVWASNTQGVPGAYFVMQDDGNGVIYNPSGQAIWSTGTNGQI
ncbi:hypothetical protein [Frankia sp. Cas3]|uniref:hypothetical protein n=1 Tax=Frankia sp. Cas3 TaxID=3073926 RepID=UPI002AD4FA66|nr:hypothetical protein [Frankia sp. Cas3]